MQAHREPISAVPTVVQRDGIWLTIQGQTEKEKPDRRKRRRKERKGKRVVGLVALGFWNDGSDRREILDWEIAKSEEQTEWEKLLNRLWERAVKPERGLQMVVRDGSGGARRSPRLRLRLDGARTTLPLSQTAQCGRQGA